MCFGVCNFATLLISNSPLCSNQTSIDLSNAISVDSIAQQWGSEAAERSGGGCGEAGAYEEANDWTSEDYWRQLGPHLLPPGESCYTLLLYCTGLDCTRLHGTRLDYTALDLH